MAKRKANKICTALLETCMQRESEMKCQGRDVDNLQAIKKPIFKAIKMRFTLGQI